MLKSRSFLWQDRLDFHGVRKGFTQKPVKFRKRRKYRSCAALHLKEVDREIAGISLPALASLAADPIAGLVDTAYLGRLGAVELAAVGIALSVFNTITKIFNIPLLSVTTSLIATAEGSIKSGAGNAEATDEASSAAIVIALTAGLIQAVLLVGCAGLILSAWGAPPSATTHSDALAFLRIKALASPITILLLVIQGIFRGIGDTKTPFAATITANALNIFLDPIFIFVFGWGAPGAAIATAIGQAVACLQLIIMLRGRIKLSFAGKKAFARAAEFIGPTGQLAVRSIAISGTFAVATSMAARTDSVHAAAHQICLQLWLASSLLADALAVAAQTLTARNLASNNQTEAQYVVDRVVKLGLVLGFVTLIGLWAGSGVLPGFFTPTKDVIAAMGVIFPWVILTQPITALAFVWDGVLFGVQGFDYAAKAMVGCAIPSVGVMSLAMLSHGDASLKMGCIWAGLGMIMALRSVAIYVPFTQRKDPFDKLYPEDINQ